MMANRLYKCGINAIKALTLAGIPDSSWSLSGGTVFINHSLVTIYKNDVSIFDTSFLYILCFFYMQFIK